MMGTSLGTEFGIMWKEAEFVVLERHLHEEPE
jgi:hypothetical protein